MTTHNDMVLVGDYAGRRSEQAFETLGETGQTVFIIPDRTAGSPGNPTIKS